MFNQLTEIMKTFPGNCSGKADLESRLKKAIAVLNRDHLETFEKIWTTTLPKRWNEVISQGGWRIPNH